MLRNGSEEDGKVRSQYEEGGGTDCEDETVTLIAPGRQNLTQFVYSVYDVNNKIFFLADALFLVDRLRCG